MNNFVFVGDIVEQNGKTVKENNLSLIHNIPIGSLVELKNYSKKPHSSDFVNGIRLFVVDHSRDCDGEPLYSLSFNLDAQKQFNLLLKEIETTKNNYLLRDKELLLQILNISQQVQDGAILKGYSEESLTVISPPPVKDVDYYEE